MNRTRTIISVGLLLVLIGTSAGIVVYRDETTVASVFLFVELLSIVIAPTLLSYFEHRTFVRQIEKKVLGELIRISLSALADLDPKTKEPSLVSLRIAIPSKLFEETRRKPNRLRLDQPEPVIVTPEALKPALQAYGAVG